MAPYQMILCYFSQEQKERSCALSSAGETPEHHRPQASPGLSREGLKCSYLLNLHSQLPSWCQDQGLGLANLVKTWDHMEVNHRPGSQACKRWWISQNWSCEMSQLKDLSQNFVLKKKKSAYISCKTETNFKPFSSVCLVQINTLHCTRIPRQCFKVSPLKNVTSTSQKWSKSCPFHLQPLLLRPHTLTDEQQSKPMENHPYIQLHLHIQVISQNYWVDKMPLSRTKANSCQSKI